MKPWLSLIFLYTSFLGALANARSYPRTILDCPLDAEGRLQLEESELNSFAFSESRGFAADGPRGEVSMKLKPTIENKKPVCTMDLTAVDGTFGRKLKWVMKGSNAEASSVSMDGVNILNCQFNSRYLSSIAQCQAPSENEPGNKCYSEPSSDFTTFVHFDSNSTNPTKLTAYSGGLTVEGYFSVWISYKFKSKFCIKVAEDAKFPYGCKTELSSEMEIRDKSNSIVGYIKPDGSSLNLSTADGKHLVTATILPEQSTFAFSNGAHVTLKGSLVAPRKFRTYWLPRELQHSEQVIVDCNGASN